MNSKVKPKGFLHVGQGNAILKYNNKISKKQQKVRRPFAEI